MTVNQTYKYTVNTVKNAIRILKVFTKEKPNWTLTEISKHLNLNISNTQRLLNTLYENDYLKKIAYQLTEEACEVLAMDEKKMWERVKTVCLNTKENYSSMVVDIQNNRQTEIDYINGYLLNKSEQALTHQLIYNLIKGKESLARDNT